MSISKTRTFIEKSGCGLAVGIVIILVLVMGILTQFGSNPNIQDPDERDQGAIIAKIDDYAIAEGEINRLVAEQQRGYQGAVPPIQEAFDFGDILAKHVRLGIAYHLAKQKGIDPTDEQILEYRKAGLIEELRSQLSRTGALQFNATEEEFKEAFKKLSGTSIDEAMEKEMDAARDRMKDPRVRAFFAAQAATPLLQTAIQNSIEPKDEEVRRLQGTVVAKAVLLPAGPDALTKAEDILKEIRGGLQFEVAIDRYSTATPPKGKKKSETTEEIPMSQVANDESYKSLRDKKPGTVSDVIPTMEGLKIYKIVKVKEMPKETYEKGKAGFRQTYVANLTGIEFNKQIAASSSKMQWESEGYRLMFDWASAVSDRGLAKEERARKVKELHEKAKDIIERGEDSVGQRMAELVLYATTEETWGNAKPAEKVKLRAERIQVLSDVFERSPDIGVAMDLIDLLIEEKDKEAATHLLTAAESNQGFDPVNQNYYTQIAAKLQKLKKLGLITPEQEKLIAAEQLRWRTEKLADDKDKAEAKRLQDLEDKKRDAEEKKQAAEDKKKADAAKKASKDQPPKTSSGATPKKPATATTGR